MPITSTGRLRYLTGDLALKVVVAATMRVGWPFARSFTSVSWLRPQAGPGRRYRSAARGGERSRSHASGTSAASALPESQIAQPPLRGWDAHPVAVAPNVAINASCSE